MTGFTVRAAAFERDEDLDAEYVVLAEQEDGGGRRLEVQRSLAEATPEEQELGMDTYCLVNELGATHYGGVSRWRVDDDQVEITLSPEADEVLAAGGGYRLRLAGPHASSSVVREALRSLLS